MTNGEEELHGRRTSGAAAGLTGLTNAMGTGEAADMDAMAGVDEEEEEEAEEGVEGEGTAEDEEGVAVLEGVGEDDVAVAVELEEGLPLR